jgi:poly(3-hydroxyalkanoate) synthetase
MAKRSGSNAARDRRVACSQKRDDGARASASAPVLDLSVAFLWPLIAAATASVMTASLLNDFAQILDTRHNQPAASRGPRWATANRIALELQTMQLRAFARHASGIPTLICAPFALHGATIADFAHQHSLVEVLRASRIPGIYLTDWRSAGPDMRFLSIDNYLADLNVAIDEIGPPVNMIGLCQGGWMGLTYAARFPEKVRRLVLAGAPIDIEAGESSLSQLTRNLPLTTFEEIVRSGEGRVLGQQMLDLWAPTLGPEEVAAMLQLSSDTRASNRALIKYFKAWYGWTVDLPGTYYLQIVTWLFRENRIARGRFEALGRVIDLANVRAPIFLLAARDDELISVDQLFATAKRVGTSRGAIETMTEPCGHLSLFLGAETLHRAWPRIAHWLART